VSVESMNLWEENSVCYFNIS